MSISGNFSHAFLYVSHKYLYIIYIIYGIQKKLPEEIDRKRYEINAGPYLLFIDICIFLNLIIRGPAVYLY